MTINIKGYDVLIDDEDYLLIKDYKWSADSRSEKGAVYFKCYAGGGRKHTKHIYLHRLIAGANMPAGVGEQNRKNNVVDHANHNTLDNRKCNLRICTQTENIRNRKATKGRMLPKGVYKVKNSYTASMSVNNERLYLGCFLTIEEAKAAYNSAAIELFGDYFYAG